MRYLYLEMAGVRVVVFMVVAALQRVGLGAPPTTMAEVQKVRLVQPALRKVIMVLLLELEDLGGVAMTVFLGAAEAALMGGLLWNSSFS